jgi:hypothetical protein
MYMIQELIPLLNICKAYIDTIILQISLWICWIYD